MVVPENHSYRVFMIDFVNCRLRREDGTDAEWGWAKWDEDEGSSAALIIGIRLRRVEFEVQFERSERYLERKTSRKKSYETCFALTSAICGFMFKNHFYYFRDRIMVMAKEGQIMLSAAKKDK